MLDFCQIQHPDEIGDLPLETQPKLLRFLDSKEIHPLGEATPQRVAVSIVWPRLDREPHHVRRPADGGPDDPGFLAAQSRPPGPAVQSQGTPAQGGLVSPRVPWE